MKKNYIPDRKSLRRREFKMSRRDKNVQLTPVYINPSKQLNSTTCQYYPKPNKLSMIKAIDLR